MSTKREFGQLLFIVGLAVTLLCGSMPGKEQCESESRSNPVVQMHETPSVSQENPALQSGVQLGRATKIIGKSVFSSQGETLGRIYDLVLTPDTQRISYAVLSHGGVWGVWSKFFAVPWQDVQVGPLGQITLAADRSELGRMRGFDKKNWPTRGDPDIASSSRSAADERSTSPSIDLMGVERTWTSRDVRRCRVTTLTGHKVHNAMDENLGTIKDFVVDVRDGQIVYTIVSFGGRLGIGERCVAVPSSEIHVLPRQKIARLDIDKQTFHSVAFDPKAWPDLVSGQYAQRVRDTFEAGPYWTVLGYTPPEPPRAIAGEAWGTEGEFAKSFDAAGVKTFEGTVESVGTFTPGGGTADTPGGLRLRIMDETGKRLTVYVGPEVYAEQKGFTVKPGDRVTVTGSPTRIGWGTVIVPSRIQSGGQTLHLRDEAGKPLWLSR